MSSEAWITIHNNIELKNFITFISGAVEIYDFAFQTLLSILSSRFALKNTKRSEFKPARNVLENLVVPFDARLRANPQSFTASGFGRRLMCLPTFPAAAGAPGAGGAAGMAVLLGGRPGWLC